MQEQWQLCDEQGRLLVGKGSTRDIVFREGLLHGVAHVWVWQIVNNQAEVLLQKRAQGKPTWPGLYDISAAGHIDLGEEPHTAALRETREEIGWELNADDLTLIAVHRSFMTIDTVIENEFQWLYLVRANQEKEFVLQSEEVSSVVWKPLSQFEAETNISETPIGYVPHGIAYYSLVCSTIKNLLT